MNEGMCEGQLAQNSGISSIYSCITSQKLIPLKPFTSLGRKIITTICPVISLKEIILL